MKHRWLRSRLVRSPLVRSQRGVTALEYSLIAAMVGAAVITGSTSFSNSLSNGFAKIGNAVAVVAGNLTPPVSGLVPTASILRLRLATPRRRRKATAVTAMTAEPSPQGDRHDEDDG